MNEEKFKEILLENNKMLIDEMDKKIDNKFLEMDKKFDKKFQEMDKKFDKKFLEMDKKFDKKFLEMDKKFNNKLFDSERRQNQKLAYLEHNYGEKISAIFDKVQSIEEVLLDTRAIALKNQKILERHEDILFSHDYRITKLENSIKSL